MFLISGIVSLGRKASFEPAEYRFMTHFGAVLDFVHALNDKDIDLHDVQRRSIDYSDKDVAFSVLSRDQHGESRDQQHSEFDHRRLRPNYPLTRVVEKCCRFGCSREDICPSSIS